MKRKKIANLPIGKDGSIIEILEKRDNALKIRLDGVGYLISIPTSYSWRNVKINLYDRIKVIKAPAGKKNYKLVYLGKQKITRVQVEEKHISKTEKKLVLNESCDELMEELRIKHGIA